MAVSFDVAMIGKAKIFTCTVSVLEQEFASVATSVYVVDDVGFATGLEMFELFSVAVGVQIYVCAPLPASVVFVPKQIETSGPALTTGREFTKTFTESLLEQPFASVPVTV